MSDPLRLVPPISEDVVGYGAGVDTFGSFFEQEKAGLFGALCLVTRNRSEAEDLTQDAFVRVLERWERVNAMDDPRGYLYRTAMNAFRSRYRRTVLHARRTLGVTRADHGIEEVDELDAAVRALAPLSRQQRAAVVLVDLIGFSSQEAGRILGIRSSTVRSHAARAHAALKGSMSDV